MTALVQTSSGQAAANGLTVATNAISTTSKNTLIATVRWGGAGDTTCTLTDTAGNTWTSLGHLNHADATLNVALYVANSIVGNAANVVTATLGNNRTLKGIVVDEWSGLDASAFLLKQTNSATAATSLALASAININTAGVLIVAGAWGASEATVTAGGSGYTLSSPTNFQSEAYKVFGAPAAAETPSFTVGTSADLLIYAAFFQAKQGGSAVDSATATGALSTGIPLQGAGSDQASGAGALSTGIPLQGAATDLASGSGALATGIQLQGAAADLATGSGSLATGIQLAGQGQDLASASGALQTGIPLAGSATDVAAGSGGLSTGIQLQGAATDVATGTGDLTVISMAVDQRYLIADAVPIYNVAYGPRNYVVSR